MEIAEETTELLAEGIRLYEAGQHKEALRYLETAHQQAPQSARTRSYYGLSLGAVEGRFGEALELCNSALKQEFFNPDLYYNLARVYRMFDFKADALRCLRRGRMIDPSHQRIEVELRDLGRRRGPILRFLPRGHAINRWLGHARHRVQRVTA